MTEDIHKSEILESQLKKIQSEIAIMKVKTSSVSDNIKNNDMSINGQWDFSLPPTVDGVKVDYGERNTVQGNAAFYNPFSNASLESIPIFSDTLEINSETCKVATNIRGNVILITYIENGVLKAKASVDFGRSYLHSSFMVGMQSYIFTNPTIVGTKVITNYSLQTVNTIYILVADGNSSGDLHLLISNTNGTSFNSPGVIGSGYPWHSFDVSNDGRIITILYQNTSSIGGYTSFNSGDNYYNLDNENVIYSSNDNSISNVTPIKLSQNGKVQQMFVSSSQGTVMLRNNISATIDTDINNNANNSSFVIGRMSFTVYQIYDKYTNSLIQIDSVVSGDNGFLSNFGNKSLLFYVMNGLMYCGNFSYFDLNYQGKLISTTNLGLSVFPSSIYCSPNCQFVQMSGNDGSLYLSPNFGSSFNKLTGYLPSDLDFTNVKSSEYGSIIISTGIKNSKSYISICRSNNLTSNEKTEFLSTTYLSSTGGTSQCIYQIQSYDSNVLIDSNGQSAAKTLTLTIPSDVFPYIIGRRITIRHVNGSLYGGGSVNSRINITVTNTGGNNLIVSNGTLTNAFNFNNEYGSYELTTDGYKLYIRNTSA